MNESAHAFEKTKKFYAFALGRADTSACHLAMLRYSGGTVSFAGFMKSMATRAVMSATE